MDGKYPAGGLYQDMSGQERQPTLKERTASGLLWGFAGNGATQLLNIVIGIFLARMLSPADYGVVGVLAIFTTVAGDLQSCGFAQALVNKKDADARDFNAVFWFNLTVSLLCYVVLFACAPLIARFFREPVLTSVSRVVFVTFVLSALSIAPSAYLLKHIMAREQALVSAVALASSGVVGIATALAGCAYWSLAFQQLCYVGVTCAARYYFVPWRPSLKVDMRRIKPMLAFSVNMLFTKLLNTLTNNMLTFFIGRLFPMRTVGNFTQAYKWNTMTSSMLTGMVDQVAQPVLASVDDDNREVRVFRKMLRFMAFVSFPAMFGFAIVAEEFITLTISSKWADSVPLLQMLCLGGAFLPLHSLYRNLVISRGRADMNLWINVAQTLLLLALIFVSARHGLTFMVTVFSGFIVVYLLVWQWAAHRLIGVTLGEVLCDILPFLLASVAVMAFTALVTQPLHAMLLRLVARVAIAALLYVAIMKLARVRMLDETVDFLRKKLCK